MDTRQLGKYACRNPTLHSTTQINRSECMKLLKAVASVREPFLPYILHAEFFQQFADYNAICCTSLVS
jgi:hypothetical protein